MSHYISAVIWVDDLRCWPGFDPPTLDVASVKLFSVVLLPAEGLPTRPINGSLGILLDVQSNLVLRIT